MLCQGGRFSDGDKPWHLGWSARLLQIILSLRQESLSAARLIEETPLVAQLKVDKR